jgi:hypothetical protein
MVGTAMTAAAVKKRVKLTSRNGCITLSYHGKTGILVYEADGVYQHRFDSVSPC